MKKLLLLFILLFTFCSSEELTYRVETRDGVRHVINTGTAWKPGEGVELEFIRTIGDFEGEDENYIFFNLRDLALDNDENLYILDAGNDRIQVFDTDRKYIRTIGRKGQGPGEFDFPFGLNISKDGTLYVANGSSRNIIALDLLGNEIKRIPCPSSRDLMRILPQDRGFIAVTSRRPTRQFTGEKASLFKLFDMEGNITASIGEALSFDIEIGERKRTVTLGGDIIDISPNGNFLSTKEFDNLLTHYDSDGNVLMTVERPIDYIIEEIVFTQTKQSLTFVSTGINIDGRNRAWVSSYYSQPSAEAKKSVEFKKTSYMHFEIFNSDGVLLGYFPMPLNYHSFQIFGDRMFFIDSDKISVSEYRIKELN